jgi:hypothetical protein
MPAAPAIYIHGAKILLRSTDFMTFLKNYSLSIVLFILFAASWGGQFLTTEGHVWANDFWNATFENWQSEFLQLFTFVVLATYLIHKDSPQSRDGDDEMQKKLDEILRRLK